jgi:flagellar basal body-associated protein FliL
MKKGIVIIFLLVTIFISSIGILNAQCSICTKTAMQQGEKPAKGLNSGIIYLMLTPFAVAGYIGYRWWQSEKGNLAE